jgi:septum formation protein
MTPLAPEAPLLCLASASPRRQALLTQIGVAHRVMAAELDETRIAGESPRAYVLRLAQAKAKAVLPQAEGLPVLAADTAVVLGDVVFGKPRDRAHGLHMLASLCGRDHEVLTAVALARRTGTSTCVSVSTVRMRAATATELAAYWDSGEPHDKAGGYAIQGLGAVLIEALHGSYSGVMGLPLFETAQLLQAAGVACWPPPVPRGSPLP